ncbi:MAG: GFA family protein [Alphaproteobacteria bacterium]
MDEWKLPWDGRCRCGKVTVRVTAAPLLASACHCLGCRRMTSSVFSLTLTVPADGFEVTAGEPVIGGLHGATQHLCCGRCLSWMFTKPDRFDSFVKLRPTLLDDQGWCRPFIEVWTRDRLPLASAPAVHGFETEPALDGYGPLLEACAREGAKPDGT